MPIWNFGSITWDMLSYLTHGKSQKLGMEMVKFLSIQLQKLRLTHTKELLSMAESSLLTRPDRFKVVAMIFIFSI
jgi:hypothetical protein